VQTAQTGQGDGSGLGSPAVAGVLAAVTALVSGLALAVIPALVMQLAAQHSGLDTLEAVLLGINLLVLAHGGGLVLDGGAVAGTISLTPLGMTLILLLLTSLAVRRGTRTLDLIEADGALRPRGLRDAATMLIVFVGLYAVALGVFASLARSQVVHPVFVSAVVSGALVAVVGALIGVGTAIRRPADGNRPAVRLLGLLPRPYGAVARAWAISGCALLVQGMVAVCVMVLAHLPAVTSMFDGLHPGWVGGAVLTLLQLALLPLVAVWAVTVLLGGTVGLGTGAGLSLGGMQAGVLPALPLLGALPAPGRAPGASWLLLLVPVLAVALGAVRLGLDLRGTGRREMWTGFVAFPLVLAISVLLVTGLSGGGIGDGRLHALGPQMGSLLLPLLAVVVLTSAVVFAVVDTGLLDHIRDLWGRLRARVERAEAEEND
jgi:hypothetical protein